MRQKLAFLKAGFNGLNAGELHSMVIIVAGCLNLGTVFRALFRCVLDFHSKTLKNSKNNNSNLALRLVFFQV